MKNDDQLIDLAHGSDSGTDESDSVQPLANTEYVRPTTTNRPTEHLRYRTERLRRVGEDLRYLADYDRALVLRASSSFTLTEPASGEYVLALASGDLWVYPALTPGRQSGGRAEGGRVFCENPSASGAWTPYSGTEGVDDLVLTAHRQYTGQRGYYDADSYVDTPSGRSIGANRVRVDLIADSGVAGGLGTIAATVSDQPRVKIRIVYGTSGTATTLADLIAFINGDRTSQGAYGVADYLRASTTGTSSNPPVPFTGGQVQGAYDAEAHQVTSAQLAAFFAVQVSGAYVNRLREGEGLAIGYPQGLVERGTVSPDGGRRQALWDLPTDRVGSRSQNTTPAIGYALFATGREPEKIPGSIPIGKIVDGEFIFVDGTRLGVGQTLELADSRPLRAALAAQTANADGAALVGYEGSGNWHSDASVTTGPSLPASTLTATLTRIVSHLASAVTNQSGARRVGVEAITPSISAGNEERELSLSAGSLRQVLNTIVNGLDGSSRLIGLNGRVSELGHRMLGLDPIKKLFGFAGMPSAGAVFTLAELHAPTNLMSATPAGVREFAHIVLQPLVFNDAGGGSVGEDEAAKFAASSELRFPTGTMTSDRFTKLVAYFPIVSDGFSGTVPLVYAKITGLSGAASAEDGYYVVKSHNVSDNRITFQNLDGTSPDFTGMNTDVTVTFYSALTIGNDKRYGRLNLFHVAGTNASKKPLMTVGAGYDTQPILDVYVPNGNTGTRGLRLTPKTIELEGETLNATKIDNLQYTVLEEAAIETDLALDFASVRTTALAAAPAGTTNIGIHLCVMAKVYSAAPGLVEYILFVGRPGAVQLPIELHVAWVASAGGEYRTVAASGFVPLNGATDIDITRNTSTNVDASTGSAGIWINSVSRVLRYT